MRVLPSLCVNRKLFPILSLSLWLRNGPQNSLHSSGLIRFKHLDVCACRSHRQERRHNSGCTENTYECTRRLCPFWFSSIPFLPRYISVLHANELSVVKLEYYRGVCLISSLPFLFPGDDPVFKRNGGLLRFTRFQISASCWRMLPASVPTPHPQTITI